MTASFPAARYRIRHAQYRIDELDGVGRSWRDSNPYVPVVEPIGNTLGKILKLRLTKPLPEVVSGIVFDAASNLRSALDLMGYAAAVAAGNSGNHAHFPFGQDDAQLRSKHGPKGRSRDIPLSIFEVMASFQPIRGGNGLLVAINELCNTNKHEIAVPAVVANAGAQLSNLDAFGAGFTLTGVWDRARGEYEVMRVLPMTKLTTDLQVSSFIAVESIESLREVNIVKALYDMRAEVERVLDAVEKESKATGLNV